VAVHLYAWVITAVVMITILAIDVFVIGRRPHEPSMKEAGLAIGAFVGLAVLFGLGVWFVSGPRYAGEFFAGWLTEYSLSVDNLFIFLIIMTKLKVPRHLQQFALLVGIILALIFRAVFIAVGAAAIERFAWVFFIFGAFLIYTAVKLFLDYRAHDDSGGEDMQENAVMRLVKRRFKAVDDFRGTKLTVVENGKRLITPMLFVIIALGSTDLLFALDSIPAIYGLTQEPYLVFAANVFALMGLRQLYFLIGGLLKKLVYLSLGLSVVLGFIGVKLVLHALHEYHLADWAPFGGEIPIWLSLAIIIGTLAVTTVASLVKSRRTDSAQTAPVPDVSPGPR
jgi:tellurite resistance protein TerC